MSLKKTLLALSISSVIGLTGCAGLIGGGTEDDTKAAFEDLVKNPPSLEVQQFGDPGMDRLSLALANYAMWQGQVLVDYEKQAGSKGGEINDAIVKLTKDIEAHNEAGKVTEAENAKATLESYKAGLTDSDKKAYAEFLAYEDKILKEQMAKWVSVVPALEGLSIIVKDPKAAAVRVGVTGALDYVKFSGKLKTVQEQAQYAYDSKAWYDQIQAQMENARQSSGQK